MNNALKEMVDIELRRTELHVDAACENAVGTEDLLARTTDAMLELIRVVNAAGMPQDVRERALAQCDRFAKVLARLRDAHGNAHDRIRAALGLVTLLGVTR